MDVVQLASPAAVATTQAPEPRPANRRAPLAVAPEPAPAARAGSDRPKATAPTPAVNEVTAAAPTPTVSLGDQPVAQVVADAIAAQVDDDLNELTDFAAPEPEQCVAAHPPQAAARSEPMLEEPASTPEEDPADFCSKRRPATPQCARR
jgi:hypothetical protein